MGARKKTGAGVPNNVFGSRTAYSNGVFHPGFITAHIELNDAVVWVTNSDMNLVGHLNFQSKTLDGGLMAASADFNVLQHSSSVLVSDRGNASLGRVKVADVTLEPPQQLPGSAVPAFVCNHGGRG